MSATERVLRSSKRKSEITCTETPSRQKAKRVKQSPAHANLDGKIYERFSKNINEELKHIKNNAEKDEYRMASESVTQLTVDAIKLREGNHVYDLSKTKASKLINSLIRNVEAVQKFSLDSMFDDSLMDTISLATDSCLFVCNFYCLLKTTDDAPNENMRKIVKFVHLQMQGMIHQSEETRGNQRVTGKMVNKIRILYTKLTEIFSVFNTLINQYSFNDAIVFKVVAISVKTILVGEIKSMQLVCVELICAIARTNPDHCKRILSSILTSIGRLSQSSRISRIYEFTQSGHRIHTFTALVLQVFHIASDSGHRPTSEKSEKNTHEDWKTIVDLSDNFLRKFFNMSKNRTNKKVTMENRISPGSNNGKEQSIVRIRFENFINDIFATLNYPEWPASSFLLNRLNAILTNNISDQGVDHSVRLLSLRFFKTLSTKARCCLIEYHRHRDKVNELNEQFQVENLSMQDRTSFYQNLLLNFLSGKSLEVNESRHFYWTQLLDKLESERKDHRKSLMSKIEERNDGLITDIDFPTAYVIAQELIGSQHLSHTCDAHVKMICRMMRKDFPKMRREAVKCLLMIAKVDESILQLKIVAKRLRLIFRDASMSMRTNIIDAIGEYVLRRCDLFKLYYKPFKMGIREADSSVQERVVKVYRDICIKYPNLEMIPQLCIEMMTHASRGHKVRKLVTDGFIRIWFTPCNNQASIDNKIDQLLDVIAMSHDLSLKWIEDILVSASDAGKTIAEACQQIIDQLIVEMRNIKSHNDPEAFIIVELSHLLAEFHPKLFERHIDSLQTYLCAHMNVESPNKIRFVCASLDLLEKVLRDVPVISSDITVWTTFEQQLCKFTFSGDQNVAQSCVSCWSVVVKSTTANYDVITSTLDRWYRILINAHDSIGMHSQMMLRRVIFTIGLIFKYFDFEQVKVDTPEAICGKIVDQLLLFIASSVEIVIRQEALISLGSLCVKNPEFLFDARLHSVYHQILTSGQCKMKITVLQNLQQYLHDAEATEITDRIIRLYLDDILRGFIDGNNRLRLESLNVVEQILRHKKTAHQSKIVPYLISLCTDNCFDNAERAEHHLKDFCFTTAVLKAESKLQLSFRLQSILQHSNVVRGFFVTNSSEGPEALNGVLYELIRPIKEKRKYFIDSIIDQFDGQRSTAEQMQYLSDNLAYFPYVYRDEPLYVLTKIESWISRNTVSSLLDIQSDEPDLNNNDQPAYVDTQTGDDEFVLAYNFHALRLLLALQSHLQSMYDISDGEMHNPSPNTSKSEKLAKRCHAVTFPCQISPANGI